MATFVDLENFFKQKDYRFIIAADAEPFTNKIVRNQPHVSIAAGGVATAFGPVAKASQAIFVARAKTPEDKQTVDKNGKIQDPTGTYTLKRLFVTEEEMEDYYFGFANQTLWPLCHVSFQKPIFSHKWFEGYKKINERFAKAIKDEMKGNTFIWLNDYQLAMVPHFLGTNKQTAIGFFWHIPWPTWETFRILPQKKEILESLLKCDFIAFHRGYQMRNFLRCVERELEARIDLETNRIHYNKHVTTVGNLPMGIDTDIVRDEIEPDTGKGFVQTLFGSLLPNKKYENPIDALFGKGKILLGVDRLDYTKGLELRLDALDTFYEKYPKFIGKVSYISILALSRQEIPTYANLRKSILEKVNKINQKYQRRRWQPIYVVMGSFSRKQIINFYKHAEVCLVTPLDDGMNLVSKEFVIATSLSHHPGMLILSQFAGSAIDLTDALIVNPYDTQEVARTIKTALEMSEKEKKQRIFTMTSILDDRNLYNWVIDFMKETRDASKINTR